MSGNMRVCCRVRPLNQKEMDKGAACVLDFHPDERTVTYNPKAETTSSGKKIKLDRFFDMSSNQRQVYEGAAKPIV